MFLSSSTEHEVTEHFGDLSRLSCVVQTGTRSTSRPCTQPLVFLLKLCSSGLGPLVFVKKSGANLCVCDGNSCPATSRACTLDQPSVHATLGFVMENVFGRARFIGFRSEKRREPLCFIKKMLAELARHWRARSFAGGLGNRPEALCFVRKIHVEHVFSVRKPMMQRHFMSKREVCGAMGVSHLSQNRDLANPTWS